MEPTLKDLKNSSPKEEVNQDNSQIYVISHADLEDQRVIYITNDVQEIYEFHDFMKKYDPDKVYPYYIQVYTKETLYKKLLGFKEGVKQNYEHEKEYEERMKKLHEEEQNGENKG